MSLTLGLYRLAMGVLEPVAPMILNRRAARGKEDPARIAERLGRAGVPRPAGPLVWLHGVSVGESLSLLPLVERLGAERPDLTLLITSGTVTSAGLLARRLPAGVIHQYAPIDGPAAVRRFLDHWRPDAAVFAESELWPNLILGTRARGARLALVSARLTEATAGGWARQRGAARTLLGAFDLILPQEEETAARLRGFGIEPGPLFNLKLAGGPLPCDQKAVDALRRAAAGRPIVLAASTHPGEEALIAGAVGGQALLISAPRHPERGPEVARVYTDRGLEVAIRSQDQTLKRSTQVYLADTLGEMGLFMRAADLVVLGGSLAPGIGGHNPLEPARLGAPTISGPHVVKNASLFSQMAAEGAVVITPVEDLANTINELLADPARRLALAAAATAFAGRQSAAFEAGWAALKPLLPA